MNSHWSVLVSGRHTGHSRPCEQIALSKRKGFGYQGRIPVHHIDKKTDESKCMKYFWIRYVYLVNVVVDSRGVFFVHESLLQCHSVKNSSMQLKRASCIFSAAYIRQVLRDVSSVWYNIGSMMVITWAITSQLKQHHPCCMTAGIVTYFSWLEN